MRRAMVIPTVLVALVSLVAGSCSDNDGGDSAARSSNERASEEGNGASPDSDPGSGEEGTDPAEEIEDDLRSLLDDAEDSVTSLLEEADDALGGVGECVDSYRTFGRLQTAILQGPDGVSQAREAAEELKEMVPEELSDEVDVIADALTALAEDGGTSGSTALTSPEYEDAVVAVNDYLMSECGLT